MHKWTKKQEKKLKKYWKSAMEIQDKYINNLDTIEEVMERDLDISALEFFWNEFGELVGIGNQWAKDEDKYELWKGE